MVGHQEGHAAGFVLGIPTVVPMETCGDFTSPMVTMKKMGQLKRKEGEQEKERRRETETEIKKGRESSVISFRCLADRT